jgi:hypothetical protein
MNKFAYAGELQALYQLGLIPRESLGPLGYWLGSQEPNTPSQQLGMFPSGYQSIYGGEPTYDESSDSPSFIRKAGPAIGATAGTLAGALLGRRYGFQGLGKNMIAGLGTGATLGWLPDIYASASEALKSS